MVLYLSVSNALYEYCSVLAQALLESSFLPLLERVDKSLLTQADRS
jgi:hypothetical protein